MAQLTLKSVAYRPDIDGLRAVSILAVLGYHGFPSLLPGGFVGVDVFFVISGYLITGLILSELQQDRFSFSSFYARRARRIFPALIVVLAATYVAGWNILFPAEFEQLGKHIAAASAFVANYVLLKEIGYFDIAANAKPLLHLWSLAVEEQFYLFWPLFIWLVWRWPRYLLPATLVLLVASFAISVDVYSTATAFYSPISRLWELAAGAALAQGQRLQPGRGAVGQPVAALIPERLWSGFRASAGVVGIILIGASAYITPLEQFPGWWAAIPVAGSGLVIWSGPAGWISRRVLTNRTLVLIGLISYPLYLWHWPLISFAWIVYGGAPPSAVICVLLAASFALAWLTYVLVELPIRFGKAWRLTVPALVAGIGAVGTAGLLSVYAEGHQSRAVAQVNSQLMADLMAPTKMPPADVICRRYSGESVPKAEAVEVCTASSEHPRLLIFGNSHAIAMYSAIYTGIREADAVLVAQTGPWAEPECTAPQPFDVWLQGQAPCQNAVRAALGVLASQPSIEVVVFVVSQSHRLVGNREKMEALQNAVLALHKRVVWLEPVPTLEAPTRCRPRKVTIWGLDLSVGELENTCRMERKVIVDGGAAWTTHMRTVASGRENVYLYDPLPLFCDAQYCHQSDDRGLLYWIIGHLNTRGSARLLDGFLPWIRETVLRDGQSSKR